MYQSQNKAIAKTVKRAEMFSLQWFEFIPPHRVPVSVKARKGDERLLRTNGC